MMEAPPFRVSSRRHDGDPDVRSPPLNGHAATAMVERSIPARPAPMRLTSVAQCGDGRDTTAVPMVPLLNGAHPHLKGCYR